MGRKTATDHKADMDHVLFELFERDDDVTQDDCPLHDALMRKRICRVNALVTPPMEAFSKWQANHPNDHGSERIMMLDPHHCEPFESFKCWAHHLEQKGTPVAGD